MGWYLLVYSTCANRPSIYFGAGKSAKMTPSGKTTAWVIQANPADQTELRACSIRDDSAFLERLSQWSCGLRSCTENCWVSQQLERYERDRISYAGEARPNIHTPLKRYGQHSIMGMAKKNVTVDPRGKCLALLQLATLYHEYPPLSRLTPLPLILAHQKIFFCDSK